VEYEISELLNEEYLQKTISGFSLSPKGEQVAEEMFNATKTFTLGHIESEGAPKIAVELFAVLEKMATSFIPVVEGLKQVKAAVEKNTAVSKKGFQSLKPMNHQSLAELVKTLPLPRFGQNDENWVSEETLVKHTGETTEALKKQRQRGESYPLEEKSLLIGRDNDGKVWCKIAGTRKGTFYLKKSLPGQPLS
jgi:hypothetical protein